ncbi:MAG: hypothetical protein RLZZ227_2150 [Pseudomonadota bacterium]|jgi:hypothetical protein
MSLFTNAREHVQHLLIALLVTSALLLLLSPRLAFGTTLAALSFEELVTESDLVFSGTVDAVSVITEGDVVYSIVQFSIDSIVKGESPGEVLALRFLGGSVGALTTEVAGQFIPARGARGVWFVDDTTRELVNPLTGWTQGYFAFIDSADGSQWLDLSAHPDYDILQPAAPLADKMRNLNFPPEQIQQRFPAARQYPLDDFLRAIAALAAEQGE